jgi:endonuclease/exonuclease/phosphatase family metal-dependent hydrolase
VARFAPSPGRGALIVAAAFLTLLLAPAGAQAVRAMTWNIAGGPSNEATGPRANVGVPFDLARVRTVVATYSPDVLALQEACTWQVDAIASALGYAARSEPAVRGLADPRPGAGGNCDYGNAVLYRSDRPGLGGFRTDLLDPRDCKGGGLLLGVAECRTDAGVLAAIGGAWIRATSAHIGSSDENYTGAGNQSSQVATIVEDAARQESTALMMGDYNIPPRHVRLAPRMSALGYTDAGGSTPGQECDPAAGCSLTSPSGGAFGSPFLKGDYIYFRGYTLRPGGMHQTGSATVGGVPASDHLPLVADLDPKLPMVTLESPAERSATADLLPELRGAVAGGDGSPVTVSLYAGSTASGTPLQSTSVTPGPDGSWATPVTAVLGDGVYTARAELAPGVYSSTNTFAIDRSPPSTRVVDPQPLTGAKPTFRLASSEPDSWPFEPGPRYECALDGGGWSACNNPARFTGVPDGVHTFRFRSIDAAGNVDLVGDSTQSLVDGTLPKTTVTTPAPGLLATGAYFAFESSEPGSNFRCQFDSGPIQACSSPRVIPALKPGRHAFNVRAEDAAGNLDPLGVTVRWDTAPVLRSLVLRPAAFVPVAPGRKGGGTYVSYAFSGRARLRLLFEQAATGLRAADQSCVAASARRLAAAEQDGAPTCLRWVARGTTTTLYGDTAVTRMRLTGRLLGKPLPPGRYRVTAFPIDAGRRVGRVRTRRFTVRAIPKPKPVKRKTR